MRRTLALVSIGLAVAVWACGEADGGAEPKAATPSPTQIFVERATQAGLDFIHQSGATGEYNYPKLLVGGGALLDIDDGLLDIYPEEPPACFTVAASGYSSCWESF